MDRCYVAFQKVLYSFFLWIEGSSSIGLCGSLKRIIDVSFEYGICLSRVVQVKSSGAGGGRLPLWRWLTFC